MKKNCILSVIVFTAVVLTAGCAHYHTGIGSKLPFQTLYVAPAMNESLAPQAQALLTEQVRNKIISDGRITLKNEDDADAVLEITICNFSTNIGTTKHTDSTVANSFNVILDGEVTLSMKDTGEVLITNHPVSASVEVLVNDEYEEAQYQAMPQVTQKLADQIYILVSTPW